ncbi:MAG: hypothetical protein COA78_07220 [Blastopirellula sp.]|nr:MAG: hypothetical protein COA78_07220 [Blastopirellula sp.]
MLIAKCPECHDPIRIPELATEASRACCPWCQQTYYLADVFETLPPVVEIIEGPGSDQSRVNQGGINAEIVTRDSAASYGLVSDASPASDFNFQESKSTGSSGAPTAKIKRSERRPRKQSSGAFEFVKIIGGGAAGCIIAVSVVWYGFGKQMGFEDNLPGWTYVIVPKSVWTEAMIEAASNANPSPVANDLQSQKQPAKTIKPVEPLEPGISQDLTNLVEDLSLELGPIGAEIPTPEEIEAANSIEVVSDEEDTEEKEAEEPAEDE